MLLGTVKVNMTMRVYMICTFEPNINGFLQVGNTDGLNHQYVFKTVLDQLGLNFKTHDITPDSKNKGLSKYYLQNNN